MQIKLHQNNRVIWNLLDVYVDGTTINTTRLFMVYSTALSNTRVALYSTRMTGSLVNNELAEDV
jgi:hypothetical protein